MPPPQVLIADDPISFNSPFLQNLTSCIIKRRSAFVSFEDIFILLSSHALFTAYYFNMGDVLKGWRKRGRQISLQKVRRNSKVSLYQKSDSAVP